MLVTKLGDKKQYLTLIIISDILLFLIPHYQMQRRELRLRVRNKYAGSGSKDGAQVAGAPRLTNNPRKIKKCIRTKIGLAMKQLLQQRGQNQQSWSRRGHTWSESGWEVMKGCHPVPQQQGKVGLLESSSPAPGAAETSLRQPWHC